MQVEIEVEGQDKGGNFNGTLWFNKKVRVRHLTGVIAGRILVWRCWRQALLIYTSLQLTALATIQIINQHKIKPGRPVRT